MLESLENNGIEAQLRLLRVEPTDESLCVAKLASAPEIIDFLGRSLQFVDRFTGPNSR